MQDLTGAGKVEPALLSMVFGGKGENRTNGACAKYIQPSAPPLSDNDYYTLDANSALPISTSLVSVPVGACRHDGGQLRRGPISAPNLASIASPNNASQAIVNDSWNKAPAIGRQAARFDLNSAKFKRQPKNRPMKRRFNPISLTHRRYTDVFCSALFAAFLVGWATVAFIAMNWGRPERLIHPTDSRGRICGHYRPGAYDLQSRPYLLFFDLTKCASYVTVLTGCPTRQVCVERCPTAYFSYLQLQHIRSATEFRREVDEHVICDESVDRSQIVGFSQLKILVDQSLCTAYTFNSAAVVGRCMPQAFVDMARRLDDDGGRDGGGPPYHVNRSLNRLITVLGDDGGSVPTDQRLSDTGGYVMSGIVNQSSTLEKIAADLSVSWWQIIAFWTASAGVCLLYALLLRAVGGAMIWLSIFALLALLGVGSGFSWIHYKHLMDIGAVNDFSFQPTLEVYLEMPTTWLVLGITFSVVFAVVLLVFVVVHARIRLAVALIEETSKALGSMLSALFFPFLPFLLHVGVFALWGSVTIWLSSAGEENCRRIDSHLVGFASAEPLENGRRCDCRLLGTKQEPNCHYVNITRDNNHVMALQAYNLFAFFWASGFVSALSDMTIAGAFAGHYFAFRKPHDLPSTPIWRSLGRSLRYHVGTLAFGSLVLSIVKFLQVILDFLYNRLKGAENPVLRGIYRILSCLFFCLETFLRFLSKNAYIMTAIYGKGFFRSARDSFNLLARNVVRVVVLGRTTAFLLFIGKAFITCGMGALAYHYFNGQWVIDGFPQVYLYYKFVPITAIVVGTYFVCDRFLKVYEMGVDTTFLCFLEDSEANDGSVEKPFYMSDNLKKILGKENKF